MTIADYLESLNRRYKTGITTEHSFRGDLQQLIESIAPGIMATNEPTRIACGAPDFIVTKRNIPLGYIEAKDIGVDLTSKTLKEQFDRYKNSLDNLIFTDYLDFHFYKSGVLVTTIRIGKTEGNKIVPIAEKLDEFSALIKDFCAYAGQSIKSSKILAEMMAGKARMLANIIEKSLESDTANAADSTLKDQMKAFKDILIHDITHKEFSDIYAQTVAYGMFAARLHDFSMDSFTRQEASEMIPKSNPFLRKLFGYIAGPDIDERIVWVVDALADIFRATDVAALLKNFGKATAQQDPIIHFYETFLAAYDPALRKARGVWYTPEPVVNFIVRAVDDILKKEFNLPDGLADRSKTKVKVKVATTDKRTSGTKEVEQEVHRVQILDPATGTGTFLAEVIKQVYKKFEGQEGLWSNYVEEHLVPRLNGFELLMASYAMAHLKLDLLLTETGYKPKKQNRLRVYLTNSLEEHHPDTGTLFANWLSTEANEANYIKRDTPVMVVMGNPPYSVSSSNKGEWIQNLISDYKKDLNERKINLDDDYIKFIRYGQYFIEKNGEGILAYISNNSFIDGVTHRQMRKALLKTFDKLYIVDLHGNAKKLETTPEGGKDENVFDIMQGVSINLFIKSRGKAQNKFGEVMHFNLYGLREDKYNILKESSWSKMKWQTLQYEEPYYFFVPKDFSEVKSYETGFKIDDLIIKYSSGIETQKDSIAIKQKKDDLINVLNDFVSLTDNEILKKYNLKEGRDWKVSTSRTDIEKNGFDKIAQILYRPFDRRYSYLSGFSKGFVAYSRYEISKNLINKDNVALLCCSRQTSFNFQHCFISNLPSERCTVSLQTGEVGYVFPLYIYKDSNQKSIYGDNERIPNFNDDIISKIAKILGLKFVYEKELPLNSSTKERGVFAPIDILDYIYAVLHSPTYREKYKEFLKIDFPRVPYPKDVATFWQLVKLGGELRQIHLLESAVVNKPITSFAVDGNNEVGKIKYENSKVWINDTQYFDKVPDTAWEFYIGGYQPAQKWLKDRKGRELNYDDIVHYQKIIVALSETARLMGEIDKVKFE